MDTVIRRGPWAFADCMLVLQGWTPLMDMEMLNYIPLWIQIRGIPLQIMNREVIVHIARALGEYIQMDYIQEVGSRLEFVRVQLNWNVNNPLKLQRNFQFSQGVNTFLRLQYERLYGFCETCGMITGDDDADIQIVPNQGVIIEEINEDANEDVAADNNVAEGQNVEAEMKNVQADAEPEDPEQEEYERNIREMEEEADDDYFWSGEGKQTMFSSDVNRDEMYTPPYPFRHRFHKPNEDKACLKRKAWLTSANGNTMKFSQDEKGETSGAHSAKRKKKNGGRAQRREQW